MKVLPFALRWCICWWTNVDQYDNGAGSSVQKMVKLSRFFLNPRAVYCMHSSSSCTFFRWLYRISSRDSLWHYSTWWDETSLGNNVTVHSACDRMHKIVCSFNKWLLRSVSYIKVVLTCHCVLLNKLLGAFNCLQQSEVSVQSVTDCLSDDIKRKHILGFSASPVCLAQPNKIFKRSHSLLSHLGKIS